MHGCMHQNHGTSDLNRRSLFTCKKGSYVGVRLLLWNSLWELLCISYQFFFKLGLNACWYVTRYEPQETPEN